MTTSTGRKPPPTRPTYRLDQTLLENIPELLLGRDQWVLWRHELRDGKWTKVPYQSHAPSKKADTTDPQTWNSYADTLRGYQATLRTKNPADGIGFVFAHDGGLVGFDLDGSIVNGELDPFAQTILDQLTPTYYEVSPSGNGIKGIVLGHLPGPGMHRKNLGPDSRIGFELYDTGRFFTITGDLWGECRDIGDRSQSVCDLYEAYKPRPHERNGHVPGGEPSAEDKVLLDKARNATNGAEFRRLFDKGEYEKFSASEADFRLCCRLAWWGNRNAAFVDRTFRASALMRDKWDSPRGQSTYGAVTVANAIEVTTEAYSPKADDPRVVIDLTADFHLTVDATIGVMSTHADVFRRLNSLVRIIRHKSTCGASKGIRRADGTPLITPFTVATTRTLVSRVARFRRFDERAKDWRFKEPPKDVAESVLGEQSYPQARELVGIIESPTIRPDGSLLWTPGYDPSTGLLYIPNCEYPAVPNHPTEAQVKAAKDELLYLVADFPFKADSDKAAWLASVLTLVVRSAIDGPVPAFLISANQAGTGKSWLATLAGKIASGRDPAMNGYSEDPAEMEKILISLAMAGDRCVVFDNASNGSTIGSAPLDRAITARGSFRGRILGKSEHSPDVPWSATTYVTGNNLCTGADALRRFIPSFLNYKGMNPESRDPKSYRVYLEHGLNLQDYVARHRGRLVTAALTIVRGFLVADVATPKLPPIDFPEWDRLIRQSVYCAMQVDPCGSRKDLAADDQTMGERTRLVNAWKRLCEAAGKPLGMTTEEASNFLSDNENVIEHKPLIVTFAAWAKRGTKTPDASTLGYLLRKHKNAPTPEGMMSNEEGSGRTLTWFVAQ